MVAAVVHRLRCRAFPNRLEQRAMVELGELGIFAEASRGGCRHEPLASTRASAASILTSQGPQHADGYRLMKRSIHAWLL